MKGVLIQTERFLLKSLTKEDVTDRYLGWVNSPDQSQYITYAKQSHSLDEVRAYVNQKANDDHILFLGIFDKKNQEHVGNVKYEPVDFDNGCATMGILIGEEKYRGKGVASEVIKASAVWLYEKYQINTIELGVDYENVNAIKAYEKCGFIASQSLHSNKHNQGFLSMIMTLD